MMSLLALLFSLKASALSCAVNGKVVCELNWVNSQSLAVVVDRTCEFPEGNKRTCARFYHCDGSKIVETGASVLFEPRASEPYCKTKSPIDLFVSSSNHGPSALVDCKQKRPSRLLLIAPSKYTKACEFPLW